MLLLEIIRFCLGREREAVGSKTFRDSQNRLDEEPYRGSVSLLKTHKNFLPRSELLISFHAMGQPTNCGEMCAIRKRCKDVDKEKLKKKSLN